MAIRRRMRQETKDDYLGNRKGNEYEEDCYDNGHAGRAGDIHFVGAGCYQHHRSNDTRRVGVHLWRSSTAKRCDLVEGKAIPSTTKNSGAFHFDTTNLPSDCVGRLQIGTEQRDVVINNCTPRPTVLKTGQTTCYGDQYPTVIPCAGTGQDGEFQKGAVSPDPRFTDNLNGTITDNLTGLIWLKDAKCFGLLEWRTAMDRVKGLADGTCGLTDKSVAGNWRVPNRNELTSLLDLGTFGPALPPGHLFTNFAYQPFQPTHLYWTSTTSAEHSGWVWSVDFYRGTMGNQATKGGMSAYFIAVRGGE